jgi:hypothetical protein
LFLPKRRIENACTEYDTAVATPHHISKMIVVIPKVDQSATSEKDKVVELMPLNEMFVNRQFNAMRIVVRYETKLREQLLKAQI